MTIPVDATQGETATDFPNTDAGSGRNSRTPQSESRSRVQLQTSETGPVSETLPQGDSPTGTVNDNPVRSTDQPEGADTQDDQRQTPAIKSSPPTVLDYHGYKVGKTIGHGSYATVKDAYSKRHKCYVAVKIISKRKAPRDYLLKFLPRETEVVRLLKHPNLIVFLQSIETNNRVYLVMEKGAKDLLEVIRQNKVIPERQAAIWFGHIVEGVDYCHEKGVVHRDLKCENILVDDLDVIKITDFGFARGDMKPKPGGDFPLSETYCGSYAYAAPEILSGKPYIPQKADIWSIGVILYVMLFGRLPFDDSNHRRLLNQVHLGPTFHTPHVVSSECRDLIKRILVRRDTRPSFQHIRKHIWYEKMVPKSLEEESAGSMQEVQAVCNQLNPV